MNPLRAIKHLPMHEMKRGAASGRFPPGAIKSNIRLAISGVRAFLHPFKKGVRKNLERSGKISTATFGGSEMGFRPQNGVRTGSETVSGPSRKGVRKHRSDVRKTVRTSEIATLSNIAWSTLRLYASTEIQPVSDQTIFNDDSHRAQLYLYRLLRRWHLEQSVNIQSKSFNIILLSSRANSGIDACNVCRLV